MEKNGKKFKNMLKLGIQNSLEVMLKNTVKN